jgi:GAF domain-containing protein
MSMVARSRQPVRIADLDAEPWAQIYYPLDAAMRMRSELAVPLIGSTLFLLVYLYVLYQRETRA